MGFFESLIILLIIAGVFTLVAIIGCVAEALYVYIGHVREKAAKESRKNLPKAKVGKEEQYGRSGSDGQPGKRKLYA